MQHRWGRDRDRCSNLHRFQMKRHESMIGLSVPARTFLRLVSVTGFSYWVMAPRYAQKRGDYDPWPSE
jgi:hypothetical protein